MRNVSGLYINDNIVQPRVLDFSTFERANAIKRQQEQADAQQKLEYYKNNQVGNYKIFEEDTPIMQQKTNDYLNKWAEYDANGLNVSNPRNQKERAASIELLKMKQEVEAYGNQLQDQKTAYGILQQKRNEQPSKYDIRRFDPRATAYRQMKPEDRIKNPLTLNDRLDEDAVINAHFGKYTPTDTITPVKDQWGNKFNEKVTRYSPEQVTAIASSLTRSFDGQRLLDERWEDMNEEQRKVVGTKENLALQVAQEKAAAMGQRLDRDQITERVPREPKEDKKKDFESVYSDDVYRNTNLKKIVRDKDGFIVETPDEVKQYWAPGQEIFSGPKMEKPVAISLAGAKDKDSNTDITDSKLTVGEHPSFLNGITYEITGINDKGKRVRYISKKPEDAQNIKNPIVTPFVDARVVTGTGQDQEEKQVLIPLANIEGKVKTAYGYDAANAYAKAKELQARHFGQKQTAPAQTKKPIALKANAPINPKTMVIGQPYTMGGYTRIWNGKGFDPVK